MGSTTIQARRDKGGRRVLCGRQDASGRYLCGESLLYPGGLYPGRGMLRHNWRRGPDGVWALRPAAMKRRNISQVVASGNLRQSPDAAAFERERLHYGDEGGRRARGKTQHQMMMVGSDALLRCPKCGGVNSLQDVLVRPSQRMIDSAPTN